MTGFNLPPGCSVRDIPGNRPEDDAAEAAYDQLYTELEEQGFDVSDEEFTEKIITFITRKQGEAYGAGWQAAIEEQKMHEEQLAIEKLVE